MTEIHPSSSSDTKRTENALRIALPILIASITAFFFNIFLIWQNSSWQLLLLTTLLGLFCVLDFFAVKKIRQGQSETGSWMVIIGMLFLGLAAALLISNIGLIFGVILMIVTFIIASQALPARSFWRAVSASIFIGILAVITDLLQLGYRLFIPEIQTFIPLMSVIVVLVAVFLIFRNTWNSSLRTKLLITFLAVALIPLGIVFFINNYFTNRDLTESADAAIKAASAQTASSLDTFIGERLNDVRVESLKSVVTEYLSLPRAERAGSPAEAALNLDLLAVARRDQTFITSVGLMDKNGLSVADTEPTEIGIDKSKRNYFIGARDTELPYVSPVELSATTGQLSLYFSAPVRDSEGNFIGVLRIRYNATVIQSIVNNSAEKSNLSALSIVVLDENHIRLAHNLVPEIILKSVVPLPADTVAQLQAAQRLPAGTPEELSTNLPDMEQGLDNIDTQPFFVAEFHDEGEGNEEGTATRLNSQSWLVAAGQDQDVYLAPVNQQTRTDLIIAIIIAAIVALAALLVAQTISNPVVRLTQVAQQISEGKIDMQANVESRDEIGTLANSFNTMTAQLRELIGSLEQRVTDRTRALATSTEVSRRLSTILDQRQLAVEVVEEVKNAFNYYHAHIYLFDEKGNDLIMAGGTGEVGQILLSRGHKISKGRGLVGRAAENNTVLLVKDTAKDPNWLPNPMLPETKSEIAVPIAIGAEVLGVLDVQQNVVDGLDEEDANLLQAISYQVAIALRNAQAYSNTQQQAEQESLINTIGRKIQNTSSVEQALQVAIRELGQALGAKDSRIVLSLPDSILNEDR